MAKLKITDIEKAVYGKDGLFFRVVEKIDKVGVYETAKITNKKKQYVDTFKRQFKTPEKFDYRPKLDTIIEIARAMGVE